MKKNVNKGLDAALMGTKDVEEKIAVIRNKQVIADADVAALYGVDTKRLNEAVRNNANKFPADFMFELSMSELRDLRSKISSTKVSVKSRKSTKVVRHFGDVLTDIVMPDLETSETESSLEINFLIGKIKHRVKRVRKEIPNDS